MVSIELALAAAYGIVSWHKGFDAFVYWQLFLLLPALYLVSSIMLDAYNGILQRGYLREAGALLKLDFIVFSITILFCYFLKMLPDLPRSLLGIFVLVRLPLAYLMRFQHKIYLRRRYSKVKYARQIVVAATESAAENMIKTITESAIRNYQFFGLVILDKPMVGEKIGDVTVSADKDGFVKYLKEQIVDEVFINLPDDSAETLALTQQLLQMGITVHIFMENSYQKLPNRVISNVFGYNVLTTTISPATFRQSLAKRCMDILGGLVGCFLTVLIAIVIGPIIYIKSPGPIFFSQIRVGKKGREFKIHKFRSMYMDAEERKKELMAKNKIEGGLMFKMDDDPRIIKGIGHFIRKTSLDEFPQFWNVLKGDMALIGPRPLLVQYLPLYNKEQMRRHEVRPGISGWAQCHGRNQISWTEKFKLDVWYVDNLSLLTDLKVIFITIKKVLFREDINSDNDATMVDFDGTN